MATRMTCRESILTALQTMSTCELDELVNLCPGFTWNEIFLELDQLSRSGEVRITQHGRSGYSLTVLSSPVPRSAGPSQDVSAR